ncbi:MAG: flagellar basal body-associated FliL family protein [Pseudomonadota bacterium]|jgi:flagellar FliL protein
MAKNPPRQQEQAAPAEEAAPAGKKRGKLLLLLLLALVLAGGGAAAWFFLLRKPDGGEQAAAKAPPAKPVFVNLEPFTVNLQPESGEQYLQVVATLKVFNEATSETVKTVMPEIRHRLLLLLSSKKASQIASVEGRQRLAEEMRYETNVILWTAAGITPKAPEALSRPITTAPAEEGQVADGGEPNVEGAPGAQAQPATQERAADKPAAWPKPAPDDPVQNVFFTSFIIQ